MKRPTAPGLISLVKPVYHHILDMGWAHSCWPGTWRSLYFPTSIYNGCVSNKKKGEQKEDEETHSGRRSLLRLQLMCLYPRPMYSMTSRPCEFEYHVSWTGCCRLGIETVSYNLLRQEVQEHTVAVAVARCFQCLLCALNRTLG